MGGYCFEKVYQERSFCNYSTNRQSPQTLIKPINKHFIIQIISR